MQVKCLRGGGGNEVIHYDIIEKSTDHMGQYDIVDKMYGTIRYRYQRRIQGRAAGHSPPPGPLRVGRRPP